MACLRHSYPVNNAEPLYHHRSGYVQGATGKLIKTKQEEQANGRTNTAN